MGAAACRNAVLAVVATAATASAGPWRVQVETGGEIDSNVQRVETGPDLDNHPYTAPLNRAVGLIQRSGRRGAVGYALEQYASNHAHTVRAALTEVVATPRADARPPHELGT